MKPRLARCLLVALGLLASGCFGLDGVTPDMDPEPGSEPGPSAVGTPTGSSETALIGPAGGTLTSADGVFELVVPPGALASEVELRLTPISNEAPLGIGGALRLEPDGTQFATPAQLVFHYENMIAGTSPELLLVATQTADGYWQPTAPLAVDADAQTATATIEHFSDWTVSTCAKLEVDTYIIDPGMSATLSVVAQCDSPATQTGYLGGAAATLENVDWEKSGRDGSPGPGTLTESGATATLEAPASPPPDPFANVSATVNHAGIPRTFSDQIVVGSVLSFSLDGHDVIISGNEGPIATTVGGVTGVVGQNTTGSVTVFFAGAGVGGFRTDPENGTDANATFGPEMTSYVDSYIPPCGSDAHYTTTSVSVSHASRERGFIRGSFDGTLAVSRGEVSCNGNPVTDVALVPIQGMFVLRWAAY
jgi:hypothetical protein